MNITTKKQVAGGYDTNTATTSISTADFNGAVLALTTTSTEARIDSQLFAMQLGNKHRHVVAVLDKYLDKLKVLGRVRFNTADGERIQGGGKAERYVLLTEDQAYFMLNLSRNTEAEVNLKVKLIQVFSEYRRTEDLRRTEYLPSYHHLQDAIHAVSATSSNEARVHMNVVKLVNKTVGLEAGQRASAAIPKQAMLIVAQTVAARAMRSGVDHHLGFKRAKHSLSVLNACTALGGT